MIKRLEQGIGSVRTFVSVMAALDFRLTGIGPGASLSEQIRRRRLKLGYSLERLAERTGLSRTTIAQLERGGGSVASLLSLMTVLAPKVRRRAPERAFWGEGEKEDRDSRFTPGDFMASIYVAFGAIDLDPCAHELSPVIARRRILPSAGGDGLAEPWMGDIVYVNPPCSKLLVWLRRAHEQWLAGAAKMVICLVPVRTDSAWFQQVLSADADIYLLGGRVRFIDARGKGQHTPFSLMLLTLGANSAQRSRYSELVPGFWITRAAPLETDEVD